MNSTVIKLVLLITYMLVQYLLIPLEFEMSIGPGLNMTVQTGRAVMWQPALSQNVTT